MSASMTDEEQKERASHAMADPEIQNILTDPVIRQILNDFNENPAEAQRAMRDPGVAAKINKLIASGVVQTR
jgi:stress-induced-phosphoprotein 1